MSLVLCHMVHWCELGLGDLLAWCDTNVSMTDHFIHALDSELLCSFALFVVDQAKRGAALLHFWHGGGSNDILQAPCGGSSVGRVPDVRWNPSCGGTGREDPEGWGRATKRNGEW